VPVVEDVARLQDGLLLGEAQVNGKRIKVRQPHADRITHMNITGKTRSGKSTFMHYSIHQDIAAGQGVAVIDPHGTLIQRILESSIPKERENDVVVLDLADQNFPPPLNPLVGHHNENGLLSVISIVERLFEGSDQLAQYGSYFRAAIGALEAEPHPTMRDIARVFMDHTYRGWLLSQIDNSEVVDTWEFQYNSSSAGNQRQIAQPVMTRVRSFYGNRRLYPILCHPQHIDFRKLIRERKIILISLPSDQLGIPELERNLVGALLVSRLQMSGMRREMHEAQPDPFFIYIDEVQNFITTSLPTMFSEAAKFGLALTVANQYLDQLGEETLNAVLGNVGTSVIFRASPRDGGLLAPHVRPEFTKDDLLNLDRFKAVVKMQTNGQTRPPFTLFPYEPLPRPSDARKRADYLRELSRQNYTPMSMEQVKAWLHDKYNPKSPVNDADAVDLPDAEDGEPEETTPQVSGDDMAATEQHSDAAADVQASADDDMDDVNPQDGNGGPQPPDDLPPHLRNTME
jgi:hypothetical protein